MRIRGLQADWISQFNITFTVEEQVVYLSMLFLGGFFYKNSVAIVSVEDPGKIITVKTNLISLPTQACDIGFFLTEHIWVRIRKEASVNFNFPPKWANLDEIHLQRVSGCSSCCCSCYLIILYTRKGIAQGRWLCTERTKLLRSHDKHPSCKAFNCHPDI